MRIRTGFAALLDCISIAFRARGFLRGCGAALLACVATAALAQDAKLTLSPALIVTGVTDRLAIESDGSLDLSKVAAQQISISPDNDVRGIKVLDTGPKSVGIALDLATNAELGKRTVTVKVDGKVGTGSLDVIQGAALGIEWPGQPTKAKGATSTLNVVARAGLDLSRVKPADIRLTPAQLRVVEISNQTADGLTLALKAPAKKNVPGTLRIGGDINLTADFLLGSAHAAKACAKLQHCCSGADAGKCTSCVPLDQVCRKPGS